MLYLDQEQAKKILEDEARSLDSDRLLFIH